MDKFFKNSEKLIFLILFLILTASAEDTEIAELMDPNEGRSHLLSQNFPDAEKNSDRQDYRRALELQDLGKSEEALRIFEELFRRQPDNASYYYKLRSEYIKNTDFDALLSLVQNWFSRHPYDTNTAAELAILLKRRDKNREGDRIISGLLSGRNPEVAARSVFNTMRYYQLDEHIPAMISNMREMKRDPLLLSEEFVKYLIDKQMFDDLIDETTMLLQHFGIAKTAFFPDILYLLPPDSPFFPRFTSALQTNADGLVKNNLLAGIYLYTGEIDDCIASLLNMSSFKGAFELQLDLLQKIREKEYFQAAVNAAEIIAANDINTRRKEMLLIFTAGLYEDAYEHSRQKPSIAADPWNTVILRPAYRSYGEDKRPFIEKAAAIYDSLAATVDDPQRKRNILLRSALIQQLIYNDNDRAMNLLKQAHKAVEYDIDIPLFSAMINVMIAKGEEETARRFLRKLSSDSRLSAAQEDRLLIDEIRLRFLFGRNDSLEASVNAALTLLGEAHDDYNDLLHFLHFYESLLHDSSYFSDAVAAEKFIQQNKYASALQIYREILRKSHSLKDIAAARMITLIRLQEESAHAEEQFWQLISAIPVDKFSDPLFLKVKKAEYHLFYLDERDTGLQILENMLLQHPEAPRSREIRPFLRNYLLHSAPG